MAIVGAFARVEVSERSETNALLEAIEGVTPFALEEEEKVGLLIEAADLDAAHDLITGAVRRTRGVLGVWPVYANTEDECDGESTTDSEERN